MYALYKKAKRIIQPYIMKICSSNLIIFAVSARVFSQPKTIISKSLNEKKLSFINNQKLIKELVFRKVEVTVSLLC